MANLNNPRPRLYEAVPRKNTLGRTVELIILFLLLSLLLYRFHSLSYEFPWLLAFICESWFTFVWILTINIKWNQLEYKTYEQTLLQWVSADELPSLDIFVTTADAVLEPPILTVNTVLSLLAVDYPSNKLACYVSDDGCSPLTFYSLTQASSFAQLWIPFCKKYNIHVRAPFRYFPSSDPTSTATMEFQHEWNMIKDEYEKLCKRIEEAAQRSTPCQLTGDFALFSNTERTNHPTIIKIISENKKRCPDSVPHLVYISREKSPKHPHHFKAGAMNVLTRVSGVMTNAPFILNVDCDMFVNNPQIVVQAMCLLIGVEDERESAYVQCPQIFYDGLKDDPYGNQLVVLHHYLVHGIVGIQGPFYTGTGCFHRRKVIYGLSPQNNDIKGKLVDSSNLHKVVGNSVDLTKSAAQILSVSNITMTTCQAHLSSSLEAAHKVAASAYEYGTGWGTKIGWMYGSTAEDALTGITIQSRGWRSTYCTPDPPAFLGCAPTGGPSSMTQQKRWATGLLEILFTTKSPLLSTLFGKLQFRQCLAYTWIFVWALRSIPEICYATLPAYCIITNSECLPKVHETAFLIFVIVFMVYNLYTLWEYRRIGESTRAWWNNQRIWRVISMSAWLFGFLSVVFKLLRLSKTVFEVTKKEEFDNSSIDENTSTKNEGFTFDDSPIFVPGTTILLINITAITYGLLGLIRLPPLSSEGKYRSEIGEIMCSICVVTCFWEFLIGLFRKQQYGIPHSTIYKSGALAFLFLQFCVWTSTQA